MSTIEIDNEPSSTTPEVLECKWFDLKTNRDLLEFNFDGYKLSLDSLAKYQLELEHSIDVTRQSELKTAKPLFYQHLKLFGFHNHLIQNEFLNLDVNFRDIEFKSIYYFDADWSLVKIEFNNLKRYLRRTNLKLEKNACTFYNERVNITMKFVSKNLAVICDGCETVYLCEIESNDLARDHENAERWKIVYKYNLEANQCKNSVIKDASFVELEPGLYQLNVLLMSVNEKQGDDGYDTVITYFRFENEPGSLTSWMFKSCRKVNCFHTVPEFVSISRDTADEQIIVAGSSLVKFVDENGQVKALTESNGKAEGEKEQQVLLKYEWSEVGHEVTVFVNLHEKSVKKDDLKVQITDTGLEISFKNEVFLKDAFYSPVVKSDSHWQLESKDGLLEITLHKKETMIWSTLFKAGDKVGRYKTNETAVKEIEVTPEQQQNAVDNEPKKIFNLNRDLEECDGILHDEQQQATNDAIIDAAIEKNQETLITEEDLQMAMYLNLKQMKCISRSYISNNKYLFHLLTNTSKSPALCLRHDVDGILWQPENLTSSSSDANFTHIHTFHAFGYVQASKQNSKFQSAAPNCSFACICDTTKHIYIYKQRSEIATEETTLRNRKTGKTVTHVSKQYVVSLDNDLEIMGVYCTNEYIVILLENVVYFIQVNL